MQTPDVVVVDYGVGNLLSVRRGLERCDATVDVTADPETILNARRVVLPGVGAFADGMAALRQRGLDTIVRDVAARGAPLLGICLGMQMLLDESEEFGVNTGLGLIAGKVAAIPGVTMEGEPQAVPHIGWNRLSKYGAPANWTRTLLEDVRDDNSVYFVHSFVAVPKHAEDVLAECTYGGHRLCAVVRRDNVIGTQFHPEKSGRIGLDILRRFLAT